MHARGAKCLGDPPEFMPQLSRSKGLSCADMAAQALQRSVPVYNPRMLYHLAQINIARLIAPLDDPKLADFVAQLDPVNAGADHAPGFVWRLQSSSGNATDIAYSDDPFVIVNMSVWESIEALHDYAYAAQHMQAFRDRPNGSRRWRSPTIVCGGSLRDIFRRWPRGASASNATRVTVRRRIRSGSLSDFLLRRNRKLSRKPGQRMSRPRPRLKACGGCGPRQSRTAGSCIAEPCS